MPDSNSPVVLITGAARRIGRALALATHRAGYRCIIHYLHSANDANALVAELNERRPNSAYAHAANLNDISALKGLVDASMTHFRRLDVLINNASRFYPTSIGATDEDEWNDLFDSNVKGAYFLSQYALPHLTHTQGQIINITDVHAKTPLKNYAVYCAAKAALAMMSQALAKEVAPVRVNCIAPGVTLWPENKAALSAELQARIKRKIPMQRHGSTDDICQAVLFLLEYSSYITGETIHVAGGRQISNNN